MRDTATRHGVPVLSANLRCDGQAPFPAARVAERGGVRLGIVGLIEPQLLGSGVGSCTAEPVQPALRTALAEMGPVDAIVVLSHLDGDDDGSLTAALPTGALVVNGHARLSHSDAVSLGRGSVQLAGGSRGKALGLAEVSFVEGADGFTGQQALGLERRLERYQGRLDQARAGLEAAGEDSKARGRAERQIEFYERELAEMQTQLDAARADAEQVRNGVSVTLVQLGADHADHPATQALVDQAKAGLTQVELADPTALTRPKGELAYTGSRACRSCHEEQHAQWSSTPHAKAWASLVAENRHLDQACWRCHATGAFDSAGPQHPLQVAPPLQGVGCESCHGAGVDHIADPVASTVLLDPPEVTCTQCHDGEQDEGRFDWDVYRAKVLHTATTAEE